MLQPGHYQMVSKKIDDFPNTKQIACCDPQLQEQLKNIFRV